MKEISLNILDIVENSVKAKAKNILVSLKEEGDKLTLTVSDDGCGMKEDFLKSVIDPFCTTRTTRKVGMGIPLLKLAAEQTGGECNVTSFHIDDYPENHVKKTSATFFSNHIDCAPIGDMVATITTLIQCNPDIDFEFLHIKEENEVSLNTKQLREILGDVPLNTYEVIKWIEDSLKEQYEVL